MTTAAQKVDGIHAELDDCRKKAEGFYEAREASIRNTQVHRIATTVEIVRGLIKGERPVSIKTTAKERGDIAHRPNQHGADLGLSGAGFHRRFPADVDG